MEKLVPTLINLQDIFKTVGSEFKKLPELVVVGSQSSGKSSVLENIVGIDFLPRGAGIVTRRPLVLQLVNIQSSLDKNKENDVKPYAEFLHLPDKKFYNFSKVRTEIEEETERLSGSNKGISTEAIHLKIFSSDVCNLTLVDLPGLVKVAVGDQPQNIGKQIEELVLSYISNKNAIILAITPANVDFATSEALMLAKQVDQFGRRTFAVVTKLDLMDKGTDAVNVLTGNVIPVKLGIIGVVNRSQLDINNKKNIKASLRDEEIFLKENYPSIASKNGTKFLSVTLNRSLVEHIRRCLPDLKLAICSLQSKYSTMLEVYSRENGVDVITSIISEFSRGFSEVFMRSSNNVVEDKLVGSARISNLLEEQFQKSVEKTSEKRLISNAAVKTAIANAQGLDDDFSDLDVFKPLVKKRIKLFEEPSLKLASSVYDECHLIIRRTGENFRYSNYFERYPKLQERIYQISLDLLKRSLHKTEEQIRFQIKMESSYIKAKNIMILKDENKTSETEGSSNESFRIFGRLSSYMKPVRWHKNTSSEVVEEDPKTNPSVKLQDDESSLTPCQKEKVEAVQKLVEAYSKFVMKMITINIPKVIMVFMIEYSTEHLESCLRKELKNPEEIKSLLQESEDVLEKRKRAQEKIKVLEKASKMIDTIRFQKDF